MRLRSIPILLAIVSFLAACASGGGSTGGVTTGIRGTVLLGPTCPVESSASPCPDRPMNATDVEVLRGDRVVARATTDEEGIFQVAVVPGEYVVRAVPSVSGPGMSTQPVEVTVREGSIAQVRLLVDSGIR